MLISDLRTAHLTRPLGYLIDKPAFSWVSHLPFTAYRIEVSDSDDFRYLLYDSGFDREIKPHAFTAAFDLQPKTEYFWRVSGRTVDGRVHTSEITCFETGKMGESFRGKWITAPFDQRIHPYFHKNFTLDRLPEKARIYVTSLGLYEVEINGKKVGNEYLAPFFNDYADWIQVQTCDITDYLREGENAIGVLMGNGWYKGRFGFVPGIDELMGDHFALLMDLDLVYEDGRTLSLSTDENWAALPSPIIASSIYDGEAFDQTKEIPGRGSVNIDLTLADSALIYDGPYHLLSDRLSPPLVIKEEIKNPTLIRTPAGDDVLDFGQVLSGWVEFKVNEAAGSQIYFQFGELLQEGNFYRENLRDAKAEYLYISDGTARTVRPHFTFYGFRYVKVSGISRIDPADFTAKVIYSDLETTGMIETDHPKVNKLFQNALWGQKGNFLDVPTDCPQRDERMGWTGDAQVFARTASYNMYTPAFFRKYLYDMLLEQRRLDGAVPFVVPDILNAVNRKIGQPENSLASAAWADAAAVIPWTIYQQYGDLHLLEKQFENMKLWADYIYKIDETHCGGKRLWQHGFHFGDWLALDNPENLANPENNSSFGGTDPYYIASAYYYYSTSLVARAAKALGYKNEQAEYDKRAAQIKAAIQAEYFDASGRCLQQTQTAQVLALYFDFVSQAGKPLVVADLKRLLDENNGHLTTGFVGTAYLCPTLSEAGLHDYAVSLLLNESYPGWLYAVNMGATTIWERWNSVLENGLVSDTGMNSMNHYAYGVIVEWMYRYLGGINPVEGKPAFSEALISPLPDSRLKHFKASYKSAYGLYVSQWDYKPDSIQYKLTVPGAGRAIFRASIEGDYTVNGKTVQHETGEIELVLEAGEHLIIAAR